MRDGKMIIPHKEFDFGIRAADESHKCLYFGCKKVGDFHVFAKTDKGNYICDFPNICDMHIIHVFLESLSDPDVS